MAHPIDPGDRRRILIADDSYDTADSLALLLRSYGHEVRVAYNGASALEHASAWQPDVVILDIGMPRTDGYEVCRQIRSAPWGAAMLLIAHTGWGKDSDRKRAVEAGFDRHFVKPVDWAEHKALLSSRAPRAAPDDAP
jgi:CheY-like chemotaxis protein